MRIKHVIFTILLTGIPTVTFAGLFGASNYAECILKYMPETTTQAEAVVARKYCLNDFPYGYLGIKKSTSIFGRMTRTQCYAKYLRATNSAGAKLEIRQACDVLY